MKENENRDKYFDHARELKDVLYMKMTGIPIVLGDLGTLSRGWRTWKSEDEPRQSSIVEIGPNTVNSPRDSRRLAATLTPVKDHQNSQWKKKIHELIPEEQMGYHKRTRGMDLNFDQYILREGKTKRKNVTRASIDNEQEKWYDNVP